MLDDEFNRQRAKLLHELAVNADPFIKRRLLDLSKRYERRPQAQLPLPSISGIELADDSAAADTSAEP